MKLPIVHSGVVDTILAALQAGGYIPNAADIDSIRSVSANLTEANRDHLAAHLAYGGGGIKLASLTDAYAFIDSDAYPATPHFNFFRVVRYQDTPPIASWKNQLFSVYFGSGYDGASFSRADAVIGVDTNLLRSAPDLSTSSGRMYFGGYRASSSDIGAYGKIEGSVTAVPTGGMLANPGLMIKSAKNLGLSFGEDTHDISFWFDSEKMVNADDPNSPAAGTLRKIGGARLTTGTNPLPMLYVDNYSGTTGSDALLIARFMDKTVGLGYYHGFDLRLNRDLTNRWLNFTTNASTYESYYTFNGTPSAISMNRHPAYTSPSVPDGTGGPVVAVYGSGGNASRDVMHIKAFLTPASEYNATILRLRNLDGNNSFPRSHYIKAERWNGTIWQSVFRVDNTGAAYCRSYNVETPDVAEWISTKAAFEPGDVLVMQPDQTYAKSSAVAMTNVMGAIATAPGVLLGDATVDPEGHQPLTVCGFIPVKCTTVAGEIIPGDRLVSAPDGCAQKAAEPVQPGTLIGKAMEPLAKENDQDVTKKIMVFVNLQ